MKQPTPRLVGAYHMLIVIALSGFLASPTLSQTKAPQKGPRIEAKAETILKSMIATLTSAASYSFSWTVSYDDVFDNRDKLTFLRSGRHIVQRPDKVRVDIEEGMRAQRYYFDGKRFSIYDPDANTFASIDFTGDIDALIAALKARYRLIMPINELIRKALAIEVMANIEAGVYVELTRVAGRKAHHLAFAQTTIDWQIWIAADGPAVPLLLVGTDRHKVGWPQYRAWFRDWRFDLPKDSTVFAFDPPRGATKVEFLRFAPAVSKKPAK